MKKQILAIIFLFLINTTAMAALGTLSVTMSAAPVGGLSTSRVMAMQSFQKVIFFTLNWGDNWTQAVPEGHYLVTALPVSNGSTFYASSSVYVTVPPGGLANTVMNYHLM